MKRILILLCCACAALAKKPRAPEPTPLEAYIQAASEPNQLDDRRASGSLWSESARLGDLASDLRARRVDDVLTIVVEERASALSRGSVSSSQKSKRYRSRRRCRRSENVRVDAQSCFIVE